MISTMNLKKTELSKRKDILAMPQLPTHIYVVEHYYNKRTPSNNWSTIKYEQEWLCRTPERHDKATNDETAKYFHARREFAYGKHGVYVNRWTAIEPAYKEERVCENTKEVPLTETIRNAIANAKICDPDFTTKDGITIQISDWSTVSDEILEWNRLTNKIE